MFDIGQVVYSKNGRDKGCPFFIIGLEGDDFIYLSDGDRRKLEKPKKKKKKHVQIVNVVDSEIKNAVEQGLYLKDSDLRSALKKITGSLE